MPYFRRDAMIRSRIKLSSTLLGTTHIRLTLLNYPILTEEACHEAAMLEKATAGGLAGWAVEALLLSLLVCWVALVFAILSPRVFGLRANCLQSRRVQHASWASLPLRSSSCLPHLAFCRFYAWVLYSVFGADQVFHLSTLGIPPPSH